MIYKEIQGDLFNDIDSHFVQCLSADIVAGAGIAVEFNNRFEMKNKLSKKYPHGVYIEGKVFKPTCIYIVNDYYDYKSLGTFNLITKEYVWQKPTYITMGAALKDLRNQVEEKQIKKLAMPLIGCGIDGLSFKFVRQLIIETFENLDIEITIYYLEKDRDIINGTR